MESKVGGREGSGVRTSTAMTEFLGIKQKETPARRALRIFCVSERQQKHDCVMNSSSVVFLSVEG
jgi:hypothetical protein